MRMLLPLLTICVIASQPGHGACDALARVDGALVRSHGSELWRSSDGGVTWRLLLRLGPAVDEDESGPDSRSDDEEENSEPSGYTIRRLASLGKAVVAAGAGGLWIVRDGIAHRIAGGTCSALATDAETRVAALCQRSLLVSWDAGHSFSKSETPVGSATALVWYKGRPVPVIAQDAAVLEGSLLRLSPLGLVDETGRVWFTQPCRRIATDGRLLIAWSPTGAWLRRPGDRSLVPLPQAGAYDLVDLVPDGAEGAFALTDVGVIHLAPEESAARTTRLLGLLPQVSIRLGMEQGFPRNNWVLLAVLTLPFSPTRVSTADLWRARQRQRRLRMETKAARLRAEAHHVAVNAEFVAPKQQVRRLLRAEELAAQAIAIAEAAP